MFEAPQILSLLQQAIADHQAGRQEKAEAAYREVLGQRPDNPDALHLLGVLHMQRADYLNAEKLLRASITKLPQMVAAHSNLGILLSETGRLEEACASYQTALKLDPNFLDAWYNFGNALAQLRRYTEAVTSYTKALDISPTYHKVRCRRAYAAGSIGREDIALDDLEVCFAAGALERSSLALLLLLRQKFVKWEGHAHLLRIIKKNGVAACDTPFALLATVDDPNAHHIAACAYVGKLAPDAHARPRVEVVLGERIRLAYVSADFRNHPASRLLGSILEGHDRNRFETFGVSIGPDDGSPLRRRMESAFDSFVDASTWTDETIAGYLRRQGIGIAIDLMGHTTHSRIGVLARRPAAIQVSFLGFPGSTGASFIDYVIGDEVVTPPESERFFSEKVCRLPYSYYPTDPDYPIGLSPSRASEGLPEDAFIFASFGNLWKLTPQVFDVWMGLIKEAPNAVLWMLAADANIQSRLQSEAKMRGVSADRIFFARPAAHADHLARHRLADLILDTFPYNGHTTASDALLMGVPTVTYRGNAFAGRVGASLLGAVGASDLVADTPSAYTALALAMARDRARLQMITEDLRQNVRSRPLFDAPRYRRDLEAAYLEMWTRYAQGRDPESFSVRSQAP
jgi:predicted O-linked N-acetylglucosamine transferase (SPINDLY family)